MPRWLEAAALVVILLAAAGLRFYQLGQYPPGLTHDEADVGAFVLAHSQGEPLAVEAPYGYANEPYTMVSAGLLMQLLGPSYLTLRVHHALYGTLLVLLTYVWARLAFDAPTGLLAAGLLATGFWPVFASRQALNTEPLPALLALAVVALWMAVYRAGRWRWAWWAVFSLAIGASFYVYEASRVAWLAFPAFGIYLFFADRPRFREHWLAGAAALAAGIAMGLPHLLDPLAWGRTGTHIGDLMADPARLAQNILEGLGTIFVRGDSFVTYNLAGRPVLIAPLAAAFLVGIAFILWRRLPGGVFAILWLLAALIPAMMLGAHTSGLHSTAAQAPVFIIPAVGWLAAVRWLVGRFGGRLAGLFAALTAVGVALLGVETAHAYFATWGQSPEARAAYFHTMAEMVDHVEEDDYVGPVILSGPFPAPPLDPFIGLMRIERDDVTLRWTDARAAVPLLDARVYASADTPIDAFLADYLALTPVDHVALAPTDANPYYDIYWLDAAETLAAVQADFAAPEEEAVFGGAVELAAYAVRPIDDGLAVGTLWTGRDPAALGPVPPTQYAHDVVIFVQALDEAGQVVAQQDILGYPAAGWEAGESFLHVHYLTVAPSEETTLLIGLYTQPDIARLPLTLDGQAAGDALRVTVPLE
jgi:hypothetical protein